MSWVIAIASVVCCLLAIGLFLTIRKLAFSNGDLPLTAEWIDELSTERYRPMMRLLDGRDLEFLSTQPGFNPRMAARIRAQRCHIFRGYLRCLSSDFRRVSAALKLIMLTSQRDRADLAGTLLRQQIAFGWGLVVVNVRLVVYRWGIGTVDVSSLVQIFDSVRIELRTMIPAAAASAA
jgi:hypothetical protein